MIVCEVDIRVGRHIVRPDLIGCRRERWDAATRERPVALLPDWICEILSPGNARHDRLRKMDLYSQTGVPHVWLVDPVERLLEVCTLTPQGYVRVSGGGDSDAGRYAPFEAQEIALADWWA